MTKAQISNYGRYRSCHGVVTTPSIGKNGYRSVQVNGKAYYVHRLVAFAFLPPPLEGQTTVNHKDLNRSHDHTNNLEWATAREQAQHSYDNNTTRKSSAAKTSKPVDARRVGGSEWINYASAMDAARQLGVHSGNISAICRGKAKSCQGYVFRFAEPTEVAVVPGEEWRRVLLPSADGGQIDSGAQVSSFGRFRSTERSGSVVSTPSPKESGYCHVQIGGKYYSIHRLIATAFELPKAKGANTVNHKDGNPSNNKLENLEWVTQGENNAHSHQHLHRKSGAAKQSKAVEGRRLGSEEESWTRYVSMMEAARELRLNPGCISAVCRNKKKQTGGYEFRLAAEQTEPEQLAEDEIWKDVQFSYLL